MRTQTYSGHWGRKVSVMTSEVDQRYVYQRVFGKQELKILGKTRQKMRPVAVKLAASFCLSYGVWKMRLMRARNRRQRRILRSPYACSVPCPVESWFNLHYCILWIYGAGTEKSRELRLNGCRKINVRPLHLQCSPMTYSGRKVNKLWQKNCQVRPIPSKTIKTNTTAIWFFLNNCNRLLTVISRFWIIPDAVPLAATERKIVNQWAINH